MQANRPLPMIARSARFQRLEPPYLPAAAGGPAGRAFEPILGTSVHVAGEEVAAGHARLRVGRRQRSDIAAGAAVRILPRQTCVPAAARQRFRSRSTRISEIKLRLRGGLRRDLRRGLTGCFGGGFGRAARGRMRGRAYRSGHLGPAPFARDQRTELVRTAGYREEREQGGDRPDRNCQRPWRPA